MSRVSRSAVNASLTIYCYFVRIVKRVFSVFFLFSSLFLFFLLFKALNSSFIDDTSYVLWSLCVIKHRYGIPAKTESRSVELFRKKKGEKVMAVVLARTMEEH